MRCLAVLLVTAVTVSAQAPRTAAPPAPEKYDIEIRYRIDAFRNERAIQFKDMMGRLKEFGFERDPEDDAQGETLNEVENTEATRLRGTIPSIKARSVLTLRPVLNILVRPAGVKLPMGDRPVRVDLELGSDLGPVRQRVVATELAEVLRKIGFRQPIGYDHRNYMRLLGALPADKVETVFNDIRRAPAAWELLPKTLLSDIRKVPGGAVALQAALESWNARPEGKDLFLVAVKEWAITEPAYRLVSELPALAVNDSTLSRETRIAVLQMKPITRETQARLVEVVRVNEVVREQLLAQMIRHPHSGPQLDKLFGEILKSPAGPLLMDILLRRIESRDPALALPQLFRSRVLVRVIEVRPELPTPEQRLPPPSVALEVQKLHPALRDVMKDAGAAAIPRRLDIVLTYAPTPNDRDWEALLHRISPSLHVEGRIGSLVSVRMKPSEALALTKLPIVSTLRLPREARSAVLRLPDAEGDEGQVLKATGIGALLREGQPQRPVRVAIIDSDFRGWQPLVRKKLPANTRLLDLTGERNANLQPDPFAGPPEVLGNGTLIGMAVAKAAPWCELLLVRIDAGCPYMVQMIHRRLHGRVEYGESLLQRRFDLQQGRAILTNRHEALLKERAEVLKLFADNRQQNDDQLEKRRERMKVYEKNQEQFDADEKAYLTLEKAYLQHLTELGALRDVRLVISGLNWNDSYPADGGSLLSRLLDDTEGGRYLWIQAAGNARGQTWSGLFRDVEANGAMEFTDAKAKLPQGSWSHEKAFLAWQPFKGERAAQLPARTKVRLTLQWREAQDAEFTRAGEDPFRTPLNELRLLVVKQHDPTGKTRPADDLSVVAETAGPPQRIATEAGSAVYEHTLEMTVDAASRLALRVEGLAAKTSRPPDTVELPASRRTGELKARIFIDTLDGDGRVVIENYATSAGEVSVPADAARTYTIGAIDSTGKPRSYSTAGKPHNVELLRKPEISTFDRLGMEGAKNVGGTGIAAGLVGGYAASLLGHGTGWENLVEELRKRLEK